MTCTFNPPTDYEILSDHLKMGGASPDGHSIYANSLYFTRDSRPFIGAMGEYHFSRNKCENWYTELCKMKAGGVQIVSTYLFWIYHEEIEGQFDFSLDRDIRRFITEAQRAGLYAFIRIGPWAHGECRNGGFPDWLIQKRIPLRQNDPEYMRYVKIWYTKIYEQLRGLFFQDGGNIIGIQFENELTDDAEHLLALKNLALEIGFRAPIYTATGWNSVYGAKIPKDELIPVFGGYMDAPWDKSRKPLPPSKRYTFDPNRNDSAVGFDIIKNPPKDGYVLPFERYPFAACELGAGLHPTYHRRYIVRPIDVYAMSLVSLGSGCNLLGYYMYHGGENKIGALSTLNESKATGYPNDYPVLDYDYQAPLGAYGQARGHYGLLNLLHLFVQDFGEDLAQMRYVSPANADENLRYCLRGNADGGFVFVNHYQRLKRLEDVKNVRFQSFGVEFPEIDITGESCFFMPYRMNLGGKTLIYATAQPICRQGDTYFFMEIEGIAPEYRFEDEAFKPKADKNRILRHGNISIITLPPSEARYLRRLNGRLYLGENCDIYAIDGQINCIQGGEFAYCEWTGNHDKPWIRHVSGTPEDSARFTLTDCPEPFTPKYLYDLSPENPNPERKWKRLSVSSDKGLIEINLPCDTMQIYADGELIADMYYCGIPRHQPAKKFFAKDCFIVYTKPNDNVYRE